MNRIPDIADALAVLPADAFERVATAQERLRPPAAERARWTCDDDCGRVHPTYGAALRHAEQRGSVPVRVRS